MSEAALHGNPFSSYALEMSQLSPDYGLPAQFDSMLSFIFDGILGTVSFVFGIQHQTDLSKSDAYVISVMIIFLGGLAGSELAEYLKINLSRGHFKRPWPVQILLKLALMVVLYTTGFVARVFTNTVSELPKKGAFGWQELYMPFMVIVAVVLYLYQPQMKQNARNEIANELKRMSAEPLPAWILE